MADMVKWIKLDDGIWEHVELKDNEKLAKSNNPDSVRP